MGIVNMLKFNDVSGAMICDEEATYFERRRTHFDENIRNLLTPFTAERFKMEAVYGGAGYPPFHYEVFRGAVGELKTWATARDKAYLKDVARLTLEQFQNAMRRRINDKLQLFFGFDSDELNQGFYMQGRRKVKIKQEKVKQKALDICTFKDKSDPVQNIFNNNGVVMGIDPKHGFRAYSINGKATVMSFLTGFESVGNGKYGAGMAFADTFRNRFLSERRTGFSRVEGMIKLIKSAIMAREYFIDIGGYFSIVYLDGKGKNHRERFLLVDPHRSKLAEEIVAASMKELITQDKCREFINRLIFVNEAFEAVEEELYKYSTDKDLLEYCLRGYKIDPLNMRPEEKDLITGVKNTGQPQKEAVEKKEGGEAE